MKVRFCYNCHSTESAFYASENGFSLVKCGQCGLLYVENRPDDGEISHAHKQGKHGGRKELDTTGSFEPKKIPRYLKVLDDMYDGDGDLGDIETWLDIGCGHGEFIWAIRDFSDRRVSVAGTEPNVHKQKSAQERGLNVGYFDLDSHQEKYDCISLLNVYSHLPDPPAFLASLKRLLNPRGELVIEMGDTADLSAADHYRPFYLPDHLSFASEEIVVGILERLDFEIISVNRYPFLVLSPMRLAKEIVKAILPGYISSLRYWFKRKLYTRTDMFIRARLQSN